MLNCFTVYLMEEVALLTSIIEVEFSNNEQIYACTSGVHGFWVISFNPTKQIVGGIYSIKWFLIILIF